LKYRVKSLQRLDSIKAENSVDEEGGQVAVGEQPQVDQIAAGLVKIGHEAVGEQLQSVNFKY